MRDFLLSAKYLPSLKSKAAELSALETLPEPLKRLILPLLTVTPSGDYDHEKGRRLSPLEHVQSFGVRLASKWGRRPIFVDGQYVDDAKHRSECQRHPLTELLERAKSSGALALPVTGIRRTLEYREAVRRFVIRNPEMPICLRIGAYETEGAGFRVAVEHELRALAVEAENVFIVFDLGPVEFFGSSGAIDLIINRINELPFINRFANLAICSTAFPEKIHLSHGTRAKFRRHDWHLIQTLSEAKGKLARFPIYGDYATEYPSFIKSKARSPRAHLRYTTSDAYVVEMGRTTRKPYGYEAIYPVAKALVDSGDFSGPSFSSGDREIHELATKSASPGTAITWRWAATDHHLTMVCKALGDLFGFNVDQSATRESRPTK